MAKGKYKKRSPKKGGKGGQPYTHTLDLDTPSHEDPPLGDPLQSTDDDPFLNPSPPHVSDVEDGDEDEGVMGTLLSPAMGQRPEEFDGTALPTDEQLYSKREDSFDQQLSQAIARSLSAVQTQDDTPIGQTLTPIEDVEDDLEDLESDVEDPIVNDSDMVHLCQDTSLQRSQRSSTTPDLFRAGRAATANNASMSRSATTSMPHSAHTERSPSAHTARSSNRPNALWEDPHSADDLSTPSRLLVPAWNANTRFYSWWLVDRLHLPPEFLALLRQKASVHNFKSFVQFFQGQLDALVRTLGTQVVAEWWRPLLRCIVSASFFERHGYTYKANRRKVLLNSMDDDGVRLPWLSSWDAFLRFCTSFQVFYHRHVHVNKRALVDAYHAYLQELNDMHAVLQDARRMTAHTSQLHYEWKQPLQTPMAPYNPEYRSSYYMNPDFHAAIPQVQGSFNGGGYADGK